jgi:hypothetical protein
MARVMAALYGRWSDAFESDGEAALVFGQMATEKVGHASRAAYQRRVLRRSNLELSGDVDLVLEEIGVLAEIARQGKEGAIHTLEEAVCLACWMEASVAEKELRNEVHESNPELRKLLVHLGGDDQRHVERLKAFAAKRKIPLLTPDGLGPSVSGLAP